MQNTKMTLSNEIEQPWSGPGLHLAELQAAFVAAKSSAAPPRLYSAEKSALVSKLKAMKTRHNFWFNKKEIEGTFSLDACKRTWSQSPSFMAAVWSLLLPLTVSFVGERRFWCHKSCFCRLRVSCSSLFLCSSASSFSWAVVLSLVCSSAVCIRSDVSSSLKTYGQHWFIEVIMFKEVWVYELSDVCSRIYLRVL